MPKRRALPQVLAAQGFAPLVIPVSYNLDLDGTTTRDFPLTRMVFKGKLRAASWVQELDVDGDKTVKVRNLTDGVDLTANLDIDALAADAGADFVLATSGLVVPAGKLVGVVYTVTTAGTVAPGECGITLSWEWIDD